MKKLFIILITISTIALLQACSSEDGGNSGNNGSIIPAVEAVQAQFGGLPLEERLNGVVSASNQESEKAGK